MANHPDTAMLTVSHRYRIDDEWHSGAGTDEDEFTETEATLRWLKKVCEDPPEYIEAQ